MKILALNKEYAVLKDSNTVTDAIVCYPDNTIIRNNEDFYIPNFASQVSANWGIYVHIIKIGKCVEAKFAHRYYAEFGVGIKFSATKTESHLISNDIMSGFDKSFAISNKTLSFSNTDIENTRVHCHIHSETTIIELSNIQQDIDRYIEEFTKFFTIKIGDIIYIPLSCLHKPIQITDSFTLSVNASDMLHCTVK